MLKTLFMKLPRKRFNSPLRPMKRYIQIKNDCSGNILKLLEDSLGVSANEAEYIMMKCPSITKLEDRHLSIILKEFIEIGLDKNDIIRQPKILSHFPITVKHRKEILQECGVSNVNIDVISSYLTIIRNKTVSQLKKESVLPKNIKIAMKLSSYLCEQSNKEHDLDERNLTLSEIRMIILEKYLVQHLGLSTQIVKKKLSTYPTIKRKPFKVIKEIMLLLQSELAIPLDKIRSYFGFINSDPVNIKELIQLKSIAGVSMRQILKTRPSLCNTNYGTFIEINDILNEYGISQEARLKCLPIYTLSSETVRSRMQEAELIPEFKIMFHHPRILRIIVYFKQAKSRLIEIRESRKICPSLHILLDMNLDDYRAHLKAPGDKTRGKDLLQGLSRSFGDEYTDTAIRKKLKEHPFWCKILLVEAKLVFDNLIKSYSKNDIFVNFCILLYPWRKIDDVLSRILNLPNDNFIYNKEIASLLNGIEVNRLNSAQILSLTLYILEKDHYFSGNGVWLKPNPL